MIDLTITTNAKHDLVMQVAYNYDLVAIMRAQSQSVWDQTTQSWFLPITCLAWLAEQSNGQEYFVTGAERLEERQISLPDGFTFKTKPYDYQLDGIRYGLANNKFLLGDEQGLGKSLQSINLAVIHKMNHNFKHCLVICGVNSIKWNWRSEIQLHSNESYVIVGERFRPRKKTFRSGSTAEKLEDLEHLEDFFVIINVESFREATIVNKIVELCKSGDIGMVIFDEMHKAKNPNSAQGKGILKVKADKMIALTGTPLMNQPFDLYPILKWLGFETNSLTKFKQHYGVLGGYGNREIVGYRNLGELRDRLDQIMLRRLKSDVLDLPEKVNTTEYVQMNLKQERIYEEILDNIRKDVDKIKSAPSPLAQFIRLRQATGDTSIVSTTVNESAKLDRLVDMAEELVDNGHKFVVFSNWEEMCQRAASRLSKYNPAMITGKIKNRDEEKERFQKDPFCKCIIGTIGAMGTGLTLTAANTVFFLDEPWNKANKVQAEDRCHRIGTTSTVSIITLVCVNTIDEKVSWIVENKGMMADMIVDGIAPSKEADLVDFLLS